MNRFNDIKNQVQELGDQKRLGSIGPLLESKFPDVFADYLGDHHITYALHAISTLNDQMREALDGLERDYNAFNDLDVASADVEYLGMINEQLTQVTHGSKTDLWYESNGRYHLMKRDDYLIMLDDLMAKRSDKERLLQGLMELLERQEAGAYVHVTTVANYVDQNTSKKVSSDKLRQAVQSDLNIVGSQDALGMFQEEIDSSHSFDDISTSADQAQYVKDQGKDLYWDDDDVATDDARPLTHRDLIDRLKNSLAAITE